MASSSRKLVTVRRVADVRPIPAADRIETVVVDGWTCICPKGDFPKGDLALFFEIDSFLPASDERWKFLEYKFKDFGDSKGFRVQSIKMRGQISQGILQKLELFPEVQNQLDELVAKNGKEEAEKEILRMSFEDVLGVKKWDAQTVGVHREWDPTTRYAKPLALEDQISMGNMPEFIPKTDQERIQNLPQVFDDWGDAVFQESTKMDGQSMTAYFVHKDSDHFAHLHEFNPTGGNSGDRITGRFGVCSRNIELVERKNNPHWEAALHNELPTKLERLGRNVAVQGELCGSSIQKNFEGFPKGYLDLHVFSVWDIDKQKQLPPKEVEELAQQLGLKHVPVHGYLPLKQIGCSITDLLTRAEGKGINGKKREGIVLKHEGGEFSFKAISNSYLLKHGE